MLEISILGLRPTEFGQQPVEDLVYWSLSLQFFFLPLNDFVCYFQDVAFASYWLPGLFLFAFRLHCRSTSLSLAPLCGTVYLPVFIAFIYN